MNGATTAKDDAFMALSDEDRAAYWHAFGLATAHLTSVTQTNEEEAFTLRNLLIATELEDIHKFNEWWAEELRYDEEFNSPNRMNCTDEQSLQMWNELQFLRNAQWNLGRDHLTELAMSQSLCPIHFVDWAICFDDQPEDCSQVRAIFPNGHDT